MIENIRVGWGRIPGWNGGEYQDGMGENTRIATLIDHILVKNLNSNSKSGIFLVSFSDHCPTYFLKKTWEVVREVLGTVKNKSNIPSYFSDNGSIIQGNYNIAQGFFL